MTCFLVSVCLILAHNTYSQRDGWNGSIGNCAAKGERCRSLTVAIGPALLANGIPRCRGQTDILGAREAAEA